ncbi:MAG: NAD(+) synthase [Bacteroidota bacterium]|nr:NAD(+) synthase [Bacteroidota bacterium]
MNRYGFIRVGAASPKLKVADCGYNVTEIKKVIERAWQEKVQLLCFPELCLTASSCGDLFLQRVLQEKAVEALSDLSFFMKRDGNGVSLIALVGLPLRVQNNLYNVVAVISAEGILGMIPKTSPSSPNGSPGNRWFTPGKQLNCSMVEIAGEDVPISSGGIIFRTPFAHFGVEIGEELWEPAPPSSELAMQGAELIFNLSASNELVGKHDYRKALVKQQSARCHAAYIYASAGFGESTTDLVFSGDCLIAENGILLAESPRFSLDSELIITDIDIDALRHDRLNNPHFTAEATYDLMEVDCLLDTISPATMYRSFNPHPFTPPLEKRDARLSELFAIQTHGLAKRLVHTNIQQAVIGISGGLDSTLALLVVANTFDRLGLPRENIHGITMPGFGTTKRTLKNGIALMREIGATIKEIPINDAVTQHLKDIGHDGNNHDVTYENSQARERTQILMDYANKVGGLVIGTGNMSELALGWTTYNGDHMSMYAVNTGVPKTLVATLVRWIADHRVKESTRSVLQDILDTPFSPELLPAKGDGSISQETEQFVGPYELHDFFLYRVLRYGDTPARTRFLAERAFAGKYGPKEIEKWLKLFYQRFFAQQFKRSCLPDGPMVGSINLSPRGSWFMPSDASPSLWLEELDI